jgi:hypothetical protein
VGRGIVSRLEQFDDKHDFLAAVGARHQRCIRRIGSVERKRLWKTLGRQDVGLSGGVIGEHDRRWWSTGQGQQAVAGLVCQGSQRAGLKILDVQEGGRGDACRTSIGRGLHGRQDWFRGKIGRYRARSSRQG